MVYADELNDPTQLIDDLDDVDVSPKELTMATQLIESLTEPFEPEKFEDTHRNQVLDLIDRKAAGEEVVAAPEPAAEDKVVDLMAALEASVRDAKAARGRHPSAKAASDGEDEEAEEAEAASGGGRGRAKSRTAKKASKASKTSKSTKAAPKRKSA
jgi:DNA end-binding protein Ku